MAAPAASSAPRSCARPWKPDTQKKPFACHRRLGTLPGEGRVRVAFAIDTHDREIITWVATHGGGISGEMIRDMMLDCVERRFNALRAPLPVQWLTDNGSAYTATETTDFAAALNLVPCFTPVRSPESNGVCEAFVKTLKRDYARVNPRPDAISVLQQLPAWFEDYNNIHPHSGLRTRSPREFIGSQLANQAECPV